MSFLPDTLPFSLDGISFEMTYIAASAVVAVGIFIQSIMLRRHQGKMPSSPTFRFLSLMDSVWVLVSAAALYFLDFDHLAISVPVVYGIYTLLGFFYAAKTIKGEHSDIPETPEDIVFDVRYLNFCQSFALVFFGLCLVLLLSAYQFIHLPSLA